MNLRYAIIIIIFFNIKFQFPTIFESCCQGRFYFIPLFFNSSIFEIIFKIIKYKLSCFKQNMNWRYAIFFFFSISNFSFQQFLYRVAKERCYFISLFFYSSIFEFIFMKNIARYSKNY